MPAIAAAAAAVSISSAIATAAITFATSFALRAISQLLQPSPSLPELPDFSASFSQTQQRTQQIRQPITPWAWVYGDIQKSGPLTFVEATDNNDKLQMVITLASTALDGWKTLYINDDAVYPDQLDGSDVVSTGKYANKVKIQFSDGTEGASQPFPDLQTAASGWTSNHLQRGRTKVYVELTFDRELFATSIPKLRLRVRGKQVLDTRTSTTIYSSNPPLCIRDYLVTANDDGGVGADSSVFNTTELNASANNSDEFVDTKQRAQDVETVNVGTGSPISGGSFDMVGDEGDISVFNTGDRCQLSTTGTLPSPFATLTDYYIIVDREKTSDVAEQRIRLATSYLNAQAEVAIDVEDSGSGTHTVTKDGEPRYSCDGVVVTSDPPYKILNDMRSSMAGRVIPIDGFWIIDSGRYKTPTLTFDEGDVLSSMKIQPRRPRRDQANAMQGVYVSAQTNGQPTNYPPITNSTFETEDGGDRIFRTLDLPFTTRSNMAQRIAKIQLLRARHQIAVSAQWDMVALKAQANDVIQLDNDRLGWSAKEFEVARHVQKSSGDPPAMFIEMDLAETSSSVFDFDSLTEESIPALPAATSLPNPLDAPNPPTSFALTTDTFLTDSGTRISRIKASWTAPDDFFVKNDGKILIEFKRSADASYENSFRVEGDDEVAFIAPVEDDVAYDVRIRAQNSLGIRSTYQTITNFTVGALSGGAASQRDYEFVNEPTVEMFDRGGVAAAVDKTLDYGSVA